MTESPSGYPDSYPIDEGSPAGAGIRGRSGPQFSIAALLWLTTAVAVLVAALFAFPPLISGALAALMSVCLPSVLLICIVYGGPGWRAFGMGAILPCAMRLAGWGFFGGAGRGSATAGLLMQQRLLQQRFTGRRLPASPATGNEPFEYFTQVIEQWTNAGYSLMTDEAVFWASSALAGLMALWAQRSLTRSSRESKR